MVIVLVVNGVTGMSDVVGLFSGLISCITGSIDGDRRDDEVKKRVKECFAVFKEGVVWYWVGRVNGVGSGVLGALVGDLGGVVAGWGEDASGGFVEAVAVYRGRPGSGGFLVPLEWGLSVHPVYLFPYFPGSSVKGVVRSAVGDILARRGLAEDLVGDCLSALFGGASDSRLGGVSGLLFLDGVPVAGGRLVEGDVLTPHYSRGGEAVETEFDASPVPVTGVSVAVGARFVFPVIVDEVLLLDRVSAVGGDCLEVVEGAGGVVGLIAAGLVHALEDLGLGGKTSRGYGRFRVEKLVLGRAHPRMRRRYLGVTMRR